MSKILEKAKNYPFSCLIIIAIWVVCLIPIPETPLDNVKFADKWTHFVMYGTLTIVIWWEYNRKHKKQYWDIMKRYKKSTDFCWKHLLVGGVLCPIIMGCLVELAQAYLTTCRSGDWFDVLCNTLGVILGGFIGIICIRRRL